MSNIPHTPEPWECMLCLDEDGAECYGMGARGILFARFTALSRAGVGSLKRQRAQVRRIVACINACKGISTEMLEQHELIDVVAAMRWMMEALGAQFALEEITALREKMQGISDGIPAREEPKEKGGDDEH